MNLKNMKSMRTFSQRALASAWLLAFGLAGCGSSVVPVGDGGTDGSCLGAGCESVVCGPTTCIAGEVCCNASCGICAAPGGACPAIGCPPPSTCADGRVCPAGDVCCDGASCTGASLCVPAGVGCEAGACRPPNCADGTVCAAGEDCCDNPCDGTSFCSSASAGCLVPDCPPPPTCADGTYCGPGQDCCYNPSDGTTFCSPTELDCLAPPASCGGFAGSSCALGEFCDYPAPGVACGAEDGTGTCAPRPEACTRVYDPVCGCDGRDYENECIAQLNGTDVSSSGTCASPASDCRTTGCAASQSCIVCGPPGTGYSCVPDGTVCGL